MRRHLILLLAVMAGFSVALAAGIAGAKSFTLHSAKNEMVGSKHETVVVNSRGGAVYWLSGDSKSHPECTSQNSCFSFWPPVKVKSAKGLSKAAGIKGKLGTWRRNGFLQLTLGGHPLYTYSGDSGRGTALGDGIKTFGGTWHVIADGSSSPSSGGTTSTGTTTTTTPTMPGGTTTTTCAYPPYCY
jgi:predicted lipoprotein with Yx(FWY)xxD motif